MDLKKFEIRNTNRYGNGVFALRNFKKGERIWNLNGKVVTLKECLKMIMNGAETNDDPLQIGKKIYIDLDFVSHAFNHSCTPNAGIRKRSELFALRDIKKDEEITYDYSTTVGPNIPTSDWPGMKCKCGNKNCRKLVGNVLTIPGKDIKKYIELGAFQDYMKKELKKIKKY
jgi:uncharacterized protein